MRCAIVIPAYNEALAVPRLLADLEAVRSGVPEAAVLVLRWRSDEVFGRARARMTDAAPVTTSSIWTAGDR
ncbi:hypothetical protein ASC64_07230 [Nocardioides sp. Root122]|uniref:hypothetical protein n=1 Tax=Nocardioides TaxID=1839 RepID=UPI000703485C|nr:MULTISPECIES: hypothetical protein [Nocardioides]KQV69626.1 hypothetical protein ASC64_07230 [Nocardioides sp. Root122]MCK9824439.1 hypothetical protein [Nocardioides cavernae]